MSYDPLSEVVDEPISVSAQDVQELKELRNSERFTDLPGVDTLAEQARIGNLATCLTDFRLLFARKFALKDAGWFRMSFIAAQ